MRKKGHKVTWGAHAVELTILLMQLLDPEVPLFFVRMPPLRDARDASPKGPGIFGQRVEVESVDGRGQDAEEET